MEHRGGFSPAVSAIHKVILAALVTIAVAIMGSAGVSAPRRNVAVRVLADAALSHDEAWKVDITRAVMDVNQTLTAISGIALKIKAYDYWTPGSSGSEPGGSRSAETVAEYLVLMGRHIRSSGREGGEIVIGLVPEGPDGPVFPGIADYLMGTVVIKHLKSKGGIAYVLLHEICHIFGAIDLRTSGSVMSLQNPSFRIDGFSRAIIRANRLRSFLDGVFPLSGDIVPEAIQLYEERRALGLGEEELSICLGVLKAVRSGQGQSLH
jgi:hypothetical protein